MKADLMKVLKHPNIIEFKEKIIENDKLIIIMEYCIYFIFIIINQL